MTLQGPQRADRMHVGSLPVVPLRQLARELVPRGHPRPDSRFEESEPTLYIVTAESVGRKTLHLVLHAEAMTMFVSARTETASLERPRRHFRCTQASCLHELIQ